MGWLSVLGPILGNIIGSNSANAAANNQAQNQFNLSQQADANARQDLYNQQTREAQIIDSFLKMTNPYQQAASNMNPFFSQAGQNNAIFSPQNMGGSGGAPDPNARFTAAVPPKMAPPVSAPPQSQPQQVASNFGNQYRMGIGGGGGKAIVM